MEFHTRILRALARQARRELARECTPRILRQLLETGLQDSREVLELIALQPVDEVPGVLAAVRSWVDPAVLPEVLEWVRSLDNTYGWRDEALRALLPVRPEAQPSPPAGRGQEPLRPEWEAAPPEERLELQRRALWDLCRFVDVTSQEAGIDPDEAFSACEWLGAMLDPSLRDEAIRMLLLQVRERYFACNAVAALCESFPPKPKASAMRAVWRELQSVSGYPWKESELMVWLRDLEPPSHARSGSHILRPEKEPVSGNQTGLPPDAEVESVLAEKREGRLSHERFVAFLETVSSLTPPWRLQALRWLLESEEAGRGATARVISRLFGGLEAEEWEGVRLHVAAIANPCTRAMVLARVALFGPRFLRVEAVVSMLEAARVCAAPELVLEELVYALNEPSVYGEPVVHAALGDYFDGVSRLPESDLVEYLRTFQPVLLRMGGEPLPSGELRQMPKDEPAVVRDDELEPNDRLEMCYGGVPFTGIAIEFHRNGVKSSETSYVEGAQSGVARDYSEDGRVVYEAQYLDGGLHGVSRGWHPDGTLKSEVVYEFGIEVSCREWDARGNSLVSRVLAPDSPLFRILEERRESRADRK